MLPSLPRKNQLEPARCAEVVLPLVEREQIFAGGKDRERVLQRPLGR